MDHELKQRLIGAVVVTALAAIFIPMLFDDPVDNSAKSLSEITAPPAPVAKAPELDTLPANKSQVLNNAEPDLKVAEVEDTQTNAKNPTDISPVDKSLIPQVGAANPAGTDIAENTANNQATPHNEANDIAPLDTGDVIPPEEDGEDAVVSVPKVKKPVEHVEPAVKKTRASKQKPEKLKAKELTTAEKTKDSSEKTSKTGSKLTRWSLQAGSYSKKENAQAVLEKLRKQGIPATMASKGNLYRIKVGPELDKKKAIEMKAKLSSLNIQSYLQTE